MDAVGNAVLTELLGHRAAFVRFAVDTVEGGGELLIASGVRQEVAGELLSDELVERQVVVEGFNNPIAVRPCLYIDIGLIAEGIRVARDIKPRHSHALAEARRGEQAIHHGFAGGWIF